MDKLIYYSDNKRHLICTPYSIENLHRMAKDLGIASHWFHNKNLRWHYDIPKTRIVEIQAKTIVIHHKDLVSKIIEAVGENK